MISRKSLILLVLVAVVPLATLAWLGWRIGRTEQARVEQQFRQLVRERLASENAKLQTYFSKLQRSLERLAAEAGESPLGLRQLVRNHPLIRQAFVLDSEGQLVHPNLPGDLSESERTFLLEIQQLLEDKDLVRQGRSPGASANVPAPVRSATAAMGPLASSAIPAADNDGWYVWHWGRGLNLMYWRRSPEERVTVLALSRARWMADLLAILPATNNEPTSDGGLLADWQITLCDSSDKPVYHWGRLADRDKSILFSDLPVVTPLTSWRLKYFGLRREVTAAHWFSLVGTWCAAASGIVGLLIVLHREYAREMNVARQRVTFVNQVSHELRTPLTTIRLYADLLHADLERMAPDELHGEAQRELQRPLARLDVIQAEAQRLSRLVTNVLAFARSERHELRLQCRSVAIDTVVEHVASCFRPALAEARIQVEVHAQSGATVSIDHDFVEQILGNLLSNVERYAAGGGWVSLSTRRQGDRVVIEVADRGPGIPAQLRQRVFDPFFRVNNQLSDATGTGIGLSIARRLARLHGGDLLLVDVPVGATFQLLLPQESTPLEQKAIVCRSESNRK